MAITGPHKVWVHPEIQGHAVDQQTGSPIAGVKIGFLQSEFGGGETTTAEDGSYELPAVAKWEWISWPGDPCYKTLVEATANGYQAVIAETGHGTGDVWGGGPAPIHGIDFRLSRGDTGDSTSAIIRNRFTLPSMTLEDTLPKR